VLCVPVCGAREPCDATFPAAVVAIEAATARSRNAPTRATTYRRGDEPQRHGAVTYHHELATITRLFGHAKAYTVLSYSYSSGETTSARSPAPDQISGHSRACRNTRLIMGPGFSHPVRKQTVAPLGSRSAAVNDELCAKAWIERSRTAGP